MAGRTRRRRRKVTPNRVVRPSRWLLSLALGVVSGATALVAVELGLRQLAYPPAYQTEALGRWRMTADLQSYRMLGKREAHDFIVSTNADGLRTDLDKERTPGVKRVAIMGDSLVFGWGVDDGQTLADGLARALQLEGQGADSIEILNAGQPGYSSTQVAWLFEEVLRDYRPDLVVVFLSLHDHNRVLVSDLERLVGAAPASDQVRIWLARHSRLYARVRPHLFTATDQAQINPREHTSEPRVPRVSPTEATLAFDQMRATLDTWGGCLALSMLPFYQDLQQSRGAPVQWRHGEDWALSYASAAKIPLLDLRACCGPNADELVLPFDHGHLSTEGNARVGAAIASVLPAAGSCRTDSGTVVP